MASNAFRECLVEIHRGEVLGEAAFAEMLASAQTPDQIYIFGSLLQLETEGKALLRPLLARLGLSFVEDDGVKAQAKADGANLARLPMHEAMAALEELVRARFLPRYLELGTLVTPEDGPEAARIAAFMGAHEQALVDVAANIVAGTEDPMAPVAALLHFPLPRPA
jgi:hypothetical protein